MRRLVLPLLLVTASMNCVLAQVTPPQPGVPKDFVLPSRKQVSLPNGLNATIVDYGLVPKATVSLVVKTGTVHEKENENGLGSLLAKLMEEGSQELPAKDLFRRVASIGGSMNASISANQLTISGTVLSEFVPAYIQILSQLASKPLLPEGELQRVKNDLKRQIAIQSNVPQVQASKKFNSIIYQDHPYGRAFPSSAQVDTYSIEDVRRFYESNVGAARATLYVVGRVDQEMVADAVKNSFSSWRAGPGVDYPVPSPVKAPGVHIVDRPKAPQTTLFIGLPTIPPSNPDYLALQITNRLLGGSFGSRITQNLREDKGYTYSPFSAISTGIKSSHWYEQADVTTEHTGASIQEIAKEIAELQKTPPSEEETNGIKNFETGIFVLQNSSPSGIIGQLNFMDIHGLDEGYLTQRVKNIQSFTPEIIRQMASRYLSYEDMTIVLVGDKASIEEQIVKHRNVLPSR